MNALPTFQTIFFLFLHFTKQNLQTRYITRTNKIKKGKKKGEKYGLKHFD